MTHIIRQVRLYTMPAPRPCTICTSGEHVCDIIPVLFALTMKQFVEFSLVFATTKPHLTLPASRESPTTQTIATARREVEESPIR